MTWDALTRRALELLAHGHSLYGGSYLNPGPLTAPAELQRRAEQLVQVTANGGWNRRTRAYCAWQTCWKAPPAPTASWTPCWPMHSRPTAWGSAPPE